MKTGMRLCLSICGCVLGLSLATPAQAARYQRSETSSLTWDLGGAAGTYGGSSYTELNLGLNWKLLDYLVWRNAVFTRMITGADTVYGLDTSARFQTFASTNDDNFGIGFFGGPGYRFSKTAYSAAFLEGGLVLKLGGLHIGGGVKQFYYTNPGTDVNGNRLSNQDTVVFLILSGGGSF